MNKDNLTSKNTLSWQECALLLSFQVLGGCYLKSVEFLALVKEVGFERAYEYVARESWGSLLVGKPIFGNAYWSRIDVLSLIRILCSHALSASGHMHDYYEMREPGALVKHFLIRYPAKRIISMGKAELMRWGWSVFG